MYIRLLAIGSLQMRKGVCGAFQKNVKDNINKPERGHVASKLPVTSCSGNFGTKYFSNISIGSPYFPTFEA